MSLAVTAVGEATRDRILRLADQLFAEHGYPRVSMRMVATAAGVTKPALYYHFRNKDALFEECVLATQKRMGEMLAGAASSGATLEERLRAVAHILLTGSPHHPVLIQNDIAEHLPPEVRERLDQGFRSTVFGPLTTLFSEAGGRGDLRTGITDGVAATAMLGVCMAFLPGAPAAGAAPEGPVAEIVGDVLLWGVGSRPETADGP